MAGSLRSRSQVAPLAALALAVLLLVQACCPGTFVPTGFHGAALTTASAAAQAAPAIDVPPE
eukprot:CAMPEP_0171089404 /NCGR_PEP_ID=MMETSP0766_2-20121228/24933_1 /TAXON_ID=439317 /ORGANISM="Gambierdiscus australes, Strain CAWD 149" /LENGTH=61 /DNA_ID=CAMNT_0011547271 /DNA_START=57 /DNA_END=239 /DNA_ORIENTATION=+